MAITPAAGWQVDPNNANGVIRIGTPDNTVVPQPAATPIGTPAPTTTIPQGKPTVQPSVQPTVLSSDKSSAIATNNAKLSSMTSHTGTYTDQAGFLRYSDDASLVSAPTDATPNGAGGFEAGGMTYGTGPQYLQGDDQETQSINKLLASMAGQLDANTRSQIASITGQYSNLINQQQSANKSQEDSINQSLLQSGSSRYAPISSAGVVNQVTSFGLQQVANLQSQENSLISQAKNAQATGNQQILQKALDEASRIRTEKQAAAQKVSDALLKANQDLQVKQKAQALDSNVANLYTSGVTDAASILQQLKAAGDTTTSLSDIAASLKNIVPAGVNDLVKTLQINGAPADVLQKVLKASDMNAAYAAAGDYAAGGTGIIGEYNYYKAQAKAAGQVPLDFIPYQIQDENHKAKAAAAGTGSSGSGSGGTYATDIDALIGNTKNTISTKFGQSTFDSTIAKARNDADKLNTIATVVLKNSPAPVREDFINQTVAIKQLDKAIALLNNGTKSGLLNNTGQYLFNLAGKDFDPKLAALNAYITSAVQPYRNSVTGAAWGNQEEQEYQSLFGSTKYSPTELKERLQRVQEIMKDKTISALNAQVNPLGGSNQFDTGASIVNNESQAQTVVDNAVKGNTTLQRQVYDFLSKPDATLGRPMTYSEIQQYLQATGKIK